MSLWFCSGMLGSAAVTFVQKTLVPVVSFEN